MEKQRCKILCKIQRKKCGKRNHKSVSKECKEDEDLTKINSKHRSKGIVQSSVPLFCFLLKLKKIPTTYGFSFTTLTPPLTLFS